MADSDTEFVLLSGLKSRLKNPRPLLKGIGALGVAQAQRAFEEKKLGDDIWPTRYPNMSEPFINIAAALEDLKAGGPVKPQRLNREPVLRDRGDLLRSINFRILGDDTVEFGVYGPPIDYAGQHNFGGESEQEVTQTARDALAKQMKSLRKARKRKVRKAKNEAALHRAQERREQSNHMLQALKKMGFIFQVDTVITEINRRPFIGVTPRFRAEAHQTVVNFFTSGRAEASGAV